jgi:hypothetical protein
MSTHGPVDIWLITRRSQVQILPPLLKGPAKRGLCLFGATGAAIFPILQEDREERQGCVECGAATRPYYCEAWRRMKPRRPVTTLIMMAPIFTLYFGSIWAALIFEKR